MLKKIKWILWNDYFGLRASFPIAQETFCSLMYSLDTFVQLSLILSWLTHLHVMATLMSVSILKLTVVPVELLSTGAFHLATPWLHFMTMTFEPMLLVSLFKQSSVHQTFSTREGISVHILTHSLIVWFSFHIVAFSETEFYTSVVDYTLTMLIFGFFT